MLATSDSLTKTYSQYSHRKIHRMAYCTQAPAAIKKKYRKKTPYSHTNDFHSVTNAVSQRVKIGFTQLIFVDPRVKVSEVHTVTYYTVTVAASRTSDSDLWQVYLSARQCPIARETFFSDTNIRQGTRRPKPHTELSAHRNVCYLFYSQ